MTEIVADALLDVAGVMFAMVVLPLCLLALYSLFIGE